MLEIYLSYAKFIYELVMKSDVELLQGRLNHIGMLEFCSRKED